MSKYAKLFEEYVADQEVNEKLSDTQRKKLEGMGMSPEEIADIESEAEKDDEHLATRKSVE